MEAVYFIIGILLIVNGAVSTDCDERDAQVCVHELVDSFVHHGPNKINCELIKASENCLLDVYERCLDEKEQAEARDQTDRMIASVRRACGSVGEDGETLLEEDKRLLECVQDEDTLLAFLRECADKALQELYTGTLPKTNNLRDAKCVTFLEIARCVTHKVGQHCGRRVEKPFYFGMMLGLKSSDAAQSPRCAAAIRESRLEEALEEYRSEKEHFRPYSVAKFVP